ncbi:MAG: hypothetical protein V3T09_08460 [bacterium]
MAITFENLELDSVLLMKLTKKRLLDLYNEINSTGRIYKTWGGNKDSLTCKIKDHMAACPKSFVNIQDISGFCNILRNKDQIDMVMKIYDKEIQRIKERNLSNGPLMCSTTDDQADDDYEYDMHSNDYSDV